VYWMRRARWSEAAKLLGATLTVESILGVGSVFRLTFGLKK
jgi:hypothetical protein